MDSYFAKYPELGITLHFDGPASQQLREDSKLLEFLQQIERGHRPQRGDLMREHSAKAMSQKIADLFTECLSP
jgi:hypothetical protein